MELTKHVAGAAILAEKLLVTLQSIGQADQELRTTLQTCHFVAFFRLQTLGHLLHGQLTESIFVNLELVVLVTRKDAL